MAMSVRPLLALMLAGALGGCATTSDRYGSSIVGVGVFAFCEPAGWAIDWPRADVPDLRAPERRDIELLPTTVPDLASLRGTLALDWSTREVPDLLAPQRAPIGDRTEKPLIELPPSRSAPSLPAMAVDVPTLLAPERPSIASRPGAPRTELNASTRSLDLGVGNELANDESRTCTRALVLASISCRLPVRAVLREPARRNP